MPVEAAALLRAASRAHGPRVHVGDRATHISVTDDLPPPPAFDLLDRADALLAVFGTVNLYDADVRGVRLTLEAPPAIELDLHLPGSWAAAVAEADRPEEYRVTLRCLDATAVHADDLHTQNVVGEYGFEDDPDGNGRRFWIRGVVGCDIDVRCAHIEVAGVEPVRAAS